VGQVSKRMEALEIIKILRKVTKGVLTPMSVVIAQEYHNDPFLILISCLLSLRAKDTKTLPVSRKLFSVAKTPKDFASLSIFELEKLIYSIGFYKQKARAIKSVSEEILTRFKGRVPSTREELLSINGIGPKTASLVLGMAFDVPAICVDVHVHRLSNAFGLVHTKNPIQTEEELERILPQEYWIEYNHLLVKLGQNLKEIKPFLPPFMQQDLRSIKV
jgi:endonuclease III